MNALARPRRHLVYLKLVPLSPSLAGFDTRFTFRCNGHGQQAYRCTISGCRPRSGSAFRVPKPKHFVDVAFFGGKLYALSQVELFVVEIDPSYNDLTSTCCGQWKRVHILWEARHSLLPHTPSPYLLLNVGLRRIASTSCVTMIGRIFMRILLRLRCVQHEKWGDHALVARDCSGAAPRCTNCWASGMVLHYGYCRRFMLTRFSRGCPERRV
ncbi:hypothetical protein HU200_035664 [Digitaria exilis]|uniref:Uncharacterized protein n=1 Tax=Digitaria exilis TaxID=1010633 RepID=A0A835BS31_9POAL|nr:hypothetical protein HU200_035664 [Digitaria exilis]